MVTLTIYRLRFQGIPLTSPVTVSLYIKPYYGGSFTLIDAGVMMDENGFITDSPLPSISINPAMKYVIRAINESCGAIYDQAVIIHPYCDPGYTLSPDESFCFLTVETDATPPSGSENAELVSGPNNFYYSIFGSLIFDQGYNVNGTGTFSQISYGNAFWVNGVGYPTYPSLSNTDGPLNRSGIWSPTVTNPQQVGFSICLDIDQDGIYYVGLGCDDVGQINLDGSTVVLQNKAALETFIQANGYPYPGGLDPNQVTFNFWYIYPVFITAGTHVLEILGNNTSGTVPGSASIGCEVYKLSAAQIAAATSYADMGIGLIFSSKDYVGMPIQIGSGGVGYTCPDGFSLKYCASPVVCVKTLTKPILY